jgi:hypothetical protein
MMIDIHGNGLKDGFEHNNKYTNPPGLTELT